MPPCCVTSQGYALKNGPVSNRLASPLRGPLSQMLNYVASLYSFATESVVTKENGGKPTEANTVKRVFQKLKIKEKNLNSLIFL